MTEQQHLAIKSFVTSLGSDLFHCRVDARGTFPLYEYVVTVYKPGTPVHAEGLDTTLGIALITRTGEVVPHNRFHHHLDKTARTWRAC